MPEKHRIAKARRADGEISDLQWDFLHDELGERDPRRADPANRWRIYELETNRKLAEPDARPCAEIWAAHRAEVLAWWIKPGRLGTRPSCWWRFEGPDGPDGMTSCVPPPSRQPSILRRLGVLTSAELKL